MMNDIEIIQDPIRRNFSCAEIIDELNRWMIANMDNPTILPADQRDQWYRDNGMICAFLRDTFPVNDHSMANEA